MWTIFLRSLISVSPCPPTFIYNTILFMNNSIFNYCPAVAQFVEKLYDIPFLSFNPLSATCWCIDHLAILFWKFAKNLFINISLSDLDNVMKEGFPPFSQKISWFWQPGHRQPAGEIQAAVKMAWAVICIFPPHKKIIFIHLNSKILLLYSSQYPTEVTKKVWHW